MSDFEDYFFKTSDDLNLYARDYPGPGNDSPVLICLHGLTRNSRDFQDLAPALADNFRVLVPEQRGRGKSDYDTDLTRYSLLQYVEDMRGLLQSLGIEQCSAVGTSMGGLMIFALNARYPGFIQRAVINDIGPDIADVGLERIKSYVGAVGPFEEWDEATQHLKFMSAAIFPLWSDEQWSHFAHQCCVERNGQIVFDYDPGIAVPLKQESSDTEADTLWSLFEAMTAVPSLLVRGELTDLLTRECVSRMQAVHPTLQLLSVPNVGHAPMFSEPGVTETISNFLTA